MPLLISIFFAALLTLVTAANLNRTVTLNEKAHSRFVVANLFAYKQGLSSYLLRNSQISGQIDMSQILMPTGYADKGLWQNTIKDGVIFIYPRVELTQDVIYEAFQSASRSPLMGINVNGRLIGITGLDTGLTVPVEIANGMLVLAGN